MSSALYTEITTGPLSAQIAPYLDTRNDAAIAALLNAQTTTKTGWASVAAFNTWCAANNAEYINIETLAANDASPYYSIAKSLLRCLTGAVADGALNFADPKVIALFDVWPFVDSTGATKATLEATGTFPASRAQVLGIDCSLDAVSATLNSGGN